MVSLVAVLMWITLWVHSAFQKRRLIFLPTWSSHAGKGSVSCFSRINAPSLLRPWRCWNPHEVSFPLLLADLRAESRRPVLPAFCQGCTSRLPSWVRRIYPPGGDRWKVYCSTCPVGPWERWPSPTPPQGARGALCAPGADRQPLWFLGQAGAAMTLQMPVATAPAELWVLRWCAEKKDTNIQNLLPLPRRLFKNSFYSEVNSGSKQCSESVTNPKAGFKSLKYDF